VEGHLTIASYRWWTASFEKAGFVRRGDIERRIHSDIEPAGLSVAWNVYVMEVPGAKPELAEPRERGKSLVELGLKHPLFGIS